MPPKAKKKGAKSKVVELTPAALLKEVNKHFGAGTMLMASDPSLAIRRIPTGILSMDYLTSGGFARDRYVEIYGSANVGKTYISFCAIAMAQKLGGRAAFIDVERTFDPAFAAAVGVNTKALAFHRQKHGPGVVNFAETLLRSGLYDVIVIDSIAALLPQYEFENEMGVGSMGMEQAKLMSGALRRLTAANQGNTVVIFINQTRDSMSQYAKAVTSGGRAMGFYAGLRLEVTRTENITRRGTQIDHKTGKDQKSDRIIVGHRCLVRAIKDKTGGTKPSEESTFVFSYTKHCHDPIEDLIYLGRVIGLIWVNTAGKWWVLEYEDEMKNDRPAFKKWLRRNVAVQEELEEAIAAATAARGIAGDDDEDDG